MGGENRSRNYARKINAAKPTEESEAIRKREQKKQAHKDKWTEWRDNGLKKRQMEKQKQYQKETKEWLARHGKEAQKELDAEILDFQQQLDAATKTEKDGEKTQKELDVENKAFQQSLPVEEGDQKHFGVTRRRKQFEAKTNKAKTKKDKEDFRIYQGENRSRNYARKM